MVFTRHDTTQTHTHTHTDTHTRTVEYYSAIKKNEIMPFLATRKWRRKWQPTPVFLPGKSHGLRILVGYSPWGRKESDTTEWLHFLATRIDLKIITLSQTKTNIIWFHLHVEFLKNDTNELIYKAETDSQTETKLMVTKQERERGIN